MQAATIIFIVEKLGDGEEMYALRELYEELDKDGDGEITKAEMLDAGWDTKFVDNIFDEADIDKDGSITLNEWIVTFINKKDLITEENMRTVFNIIDASEDGTLDLQELKDELQKNFKFTNEDWHFIVDEVDGDGSGTIDFDEFRTMMMNCVQEIVPDKEKSPYVR